MPTDPVVTIDAETATDLREWLWSLHHEFEHEIPAPPATIEDCLAEIAAGIDGQIGCDVEQVTLSFARTRSPDRRSWDDPLPDEDPVERHTQDGSQTVDTGYFEPEPDLEDDFATLDEQRRIIDAHGPLGGPEYHRSHDPLSSENATVNLQSAANSAGDPDRSDRYLTTFQCSACEAERELESSHKVSAFVGDCPSCGAADVRFVAVSLPERQR